MDSQSTQTIKLPILQPGEYDLWKMRMEQYLQCIDYTLWEIQQQQQQQRYPIPPEQGMGEVRCRQIVPLPFTGKETASE
ncbi:hypothetical protein Tco_0634805 [Tanacetum coccineum]